MRLRHIVFILVLAAAAAAAGRFLLSLNSAWSAPGPLAAPTLVYFPPGGGGKAMAAKLAENGVIGDAFTFRVLAKLNRVNGELKAGEYRFTPHISIAAIVALLQSGKTYQHMLTLPEGLTSAEIAAMVNLAPAMTGAAETPPEGALLPETYSYSYGDARGGLIARMQKSMQDALPLLWQGRDPDVPLKTAEEAVTLASIVEKETGIASERPRIAAVFYNRLKINMPLQSDPTVAYGVTGGKEKLNHGLTRAELDAPSPYNTYLNPGLPPGPIANPGRAALAAVLHPEKNDYLYFVADGSGGHAFAASLSEHNRNVENWRRIEKAGK